MQSDSDGVLASAMAHLEDAGVAVTELSATGAEAVLRLSFGGRAFTYDAQIKGRVGAASAHASRSLPDRKLLLIAPHIADQAGDALRGQNVHYVDSVGNMYLRQEGLLLDVRGRRRPTVQPGKPGKPLRAFKSSGLKVIFALLADPLMVTASYRDISQASGVSLGTVQWVLTELETAGYATIKPRQLYRTRNLFDRWVEAYAFDLWPRLTLASFDAADPNWWRDADDSLRAVGAQWGGESAAHWMNPHLRPKKAVLYAPEVPRRLALEYRFQKPQGEGDVEIRHRFWRLPDNSSMTVPTPLVYGDLIASGDPRLTEAAVDLREKDALLRRIDRD